MHSIQTSRTAGMNRKLPLLLFVLAAFAAGALFVTAGDALFGDDLIGGAAAQVADTPEAREGMAAASELGAAFAAVAEAVNPAVVSITTTQLPDEEARAQPNPFEGSPFEDFFRGFGGPQQQGPRQGLGSGAVIRADGYIVTNDHVVADADEVRVRFFDGTSMMGEVVGTDPLTDLAVVRVDADGLPTIPFGSVSDLRVGEWVLAVGNPFQQSLSNTVTAGIVSGLGRAGQAGLNPIQDFIQTDAAINPGNSGGPLVNLRGEIVGINSAIATRTGGYQGIGFAIPVSIVEGTVEQLVETGRVERGLLGVGFEPIAQAAARALGVPTGAAQVSTVQPGSAADDAGIEAGDIIVAVEGDELTTAYQLQALIGTRRPGDEVVLTVLRADGDRDDVAVELGRREDDVAAAEPDRRDRRPSSASSESVEMLGMTLADPSPALVRQWELPRDAEGVVVTEVSRSSLAFRDANVRPGDLILRVGGEPVSSLRDFERAYDRINEGETFLLTVRRAGEAGGVYRTALTKE